MTEKIRHSFEAPRRGKPDEIESGIANLISAYFLEIDPISRFDLRVVGGYDLKSQKPTVQVSGEVTDFLLDASLESELCQLIVQRYNKVHRTQLKQDEIDVSFAFNAQAAPLADNSYEGDSGVAIGVACKKAPSALPWERFIAVGIRDIMDSLYQRRAGNSFSPFLIFDRSGKERILGLRADGKIGVDALYEGPNLHCIEKITVAAEHESSLPIEELKKKSNELIRIYLEALEYKYSISLGEPVIEVNGLGDWNEGGGWCGDEGSREAKPYRDGFATHGCCEDALAGEDATKPGLRRTLLARYIARQVIHNDLADYARVSLSYVIGKEEIDLNIWTNGTGRVSQEELEHNVRKRIPLDISTSIERFGLRNPATYRAVVEASDFFHDYRFPWNSGEVKL